MRYLILILAVVLTSCASPSEAPSTSTGDLSHSYSPSVSDHVCVEVFNAKSNLISTVLDSDVDDLEMRDQFKDWLTTNLFPNGIPDHAVRIKPELSDYTDFVDEDEGGTCIGMDGTILCEVSSNKFWPLYTDNAKDTFSQFIDDTPVSESNIASAECVWLHEIIHTVQWQNRNRVVDFCRADVPFEYSSRYAYELSSITDLKYASPETSAKVVQDYCRCAYGGLSTSSHNLEGSSCSELENLVKSSTGY